MKILLPTFISILKRQLHKMVKHTQTIRRFLPTNCLSVFDHYVGLALKGLNSLINMTSISMLKKWNYGSWIWGRSSRPEVFFKKKVFSEISQNSQENTCPGVSFIITLQASNFIKKQILIKVFSCEFCTFSKNILQNTYDGCFW